MKKLFKNKTIKLVTALIALAIVTIALVAHAVPFFKTTAAVSPSGNVFAGPGRLNSIQIYNPSTVPTVVYFYDSSSTNYTGTNNAYTNYTVITARATNIYTNFFGSLNTNIFNYKSNVVQNVATGTYTNRLVNVIAIPASNTVVSTLTVPLMFGLMYSNTVVAGSNLVITADINPQQ